MVFTSPKGTVYRYVHGVTGGTSIAVKADNNSMKLYGFHNNPELVKYGPIELGDNWTIVQNVHMLTQEEQLKLVKCLDSYVKHNVRWTPPKGFGADFVNGCLIVWPKGQEGYDKPTQPTTRFVELDRIFGTIQYPKNTTGTTQSNTGKSDGSSADYYKLPQGCSQLQDLISHCDMNAQMGEIFRAAYRYGRASHSDKLRDAKKIKFYIEAEIKRLES